MKSQETSIEQSRRLLELKDIAGYLPYGLKVQDRDMDIWSLSQLGNANPCMDGDIGLCTDDGSYQQYDYLDKIKPILRPMYDLTKEITHRGETFVPMVELAKLSINWVKTVWDVSDNGLFVYGLYGCSGDIIKFYYRPSCFYVSETNATERDNDQVILFNKLAEWMFDYRGLISAGLAVDVNMLTENPYEV